MNVSVVEAVWLTCRFSSKDQVVDEDAMHPFIQIYG